MYNFNHPLPVDATYSFFHFTRDSSCIEKNEGTSKYEGHTATEPDKEKIRNTEEVLLLDSFEKEFRKENTL